MTCPCPYCYLQSGVLSIYQALEIGFQPIDGQIEYGVCIVCGTSHAHATESPSSRDFQ